MYKHEIIVGMTQNHRTLVYIVSNSLDLALDGLESNSLVWDSNNG